MPHADDEGNQLIVPDIRDYQRINAELVRLLDSGSPLIRLVGVERQRLLASGLVGAWNAMIVVEGSAGPELASGTDAPGLTIVCRGDAADGLARGLKAGRVLVAGSASAGCGYAQSGGELVVAGRAGDRAGLNISGGVQWYRAGAGRLLGERQSGGVIFVQGGELGPFAGRGASNPRVVTLAESTADATPGLPADDLALLRRLESWVAPLL